MQLSAEPEPEPDPRLDRYRRGAALVFDGDRLVGHLVTRVVVCRTVLGHLWWRRGVDPAERLDWSVAWTPDEARRFGFGSTDGIEDDIEAIIDELGANRFVLEDHTYRLEWCAGSKAEAIWAELGWD